MPAKFNSLSRNVVIMVVATLTSAAMVSTAVSAAPQSLLQIVPVA